MDQLHHQWDCEGKCAYTTLLKKVLLQQGPAAIACCLLQALREPFPI
jgi:hypothetical protein